MYTDLKTLYSKVGTKQEFSLLFCILIKKFRVLYFFITVYSVQIDNDFKILAPFISGVYKHKVRFLSLGEQLLKQEVLSEVLYYMQQEQDVLCSYAVSRICGYFTIASQS